MKKDFAGKVALVTGASSGIGRATALAFASSGAKTVVAARRQVEGEAVVKEVEAAGGEAIFIRTDVTRELEVKNLMKRLQAAYGWTSPSTTPVLAKPDG